MISESSLTRVSSSWSCSSGATIWLYRSTWAVCGHLARFGQSRELVDHVLRRLGHPGAVGLVDPLQLEPYPVDDRVDDLLLLVGAVLQLLCSKAGTTTRQRGHAPVRAPGPDRAVPRVVGRSRGPSVSGHAVDGGDDTGGGERDAHHGRDQDQSRKARANAPVSQAEPGGRPLATVACRSTPAIGCRRRHRSRYPSPSRHKWNSSDHKVT